MHVIKLSTYEIQLARGVAGHRDGSSYCGYRYGIRPGLPYSGISFFGSANYPGNLGQARNARRETADRAVSDIDLAS